MSMSSKRKKRVRDKVEGGQADVVERTVEAAVKNKDTTAPRKRARIEQNFNAVAVAASSKPCPTGSVKDEDSFPYLTEQDDHCESPLEAYSDIALLLKRLEHNATRKTSFTIYDPYYCNGAVCRHLQQLGFANVYNRKEDCYEQWKLASFDIGDVIVTNPPYSGDHIQRLIEYVTGSSCRNKPFFLLLPNWVIKKDYYQACTAAIRPFYLVPHKRYVYLPPKDFRSAKKSDTHKKSAPFISMWYCWGGTDAMNEQLIKLCYEQAGKSTFDLARSKSALRDLRRKKR